MEEQLALLEGRVRELEEELKYVMEYILRKQRAEAKRREHTDVPHSGLVLPSFKTKKL